ncbi:MULTISPECIES: WXG100 family type VII secretion target [Cryobacterium]|jgi:WXG100 family type VII secretion target|uniref:Type VII secretion protein n=1 Tax=Cryobacterium arcticum TaxID=670052 RepID=A0A1B1BMZ7_9MICO|nr:MULTISPECIES: WXG100 family type VII secretion target [Cryobacterium]ANP73934.1 type VII secretion protein [Cryobacterium arcticum]
MANMNVTYSEMRDASKNLISGKDDLTAKLSQLQSLVNNLVAGGFVTDAASGAFHTSYEQFTKGTTEAVNGLTGMSEFLIRAADAMENVDSELARGISG